MKKLVLAATMAALAMPAWADSGRLACQRELGGIVQWRNANPQADPNLRIDDWIEVLSAQCRYSSGLAEASMDSLRQRLEASSGQQVGYGNQTTEWPSVASLAD